MRNIREGLMYLIYWSVFALVFFVSVKTRATTLYSNELYETLLTKVARSRPLVADPCLYSIYGDPPTAEGNFVKIFLYCNKMENSTNSFHLGVLRRDTYRDLFTELGRINSFAVDFVDNGKIRLGNDAKQTDSSWKCFSDHERITDFSQTIRKRTRIECFFNYSDRDIQKMYE